MIPVCAPLIAPEDAAAVAECLAGGWVSSSGPWVERFERAWADLCGMEEGVAVSNGTAALFIAARLLDLRPGEEVIMPAFTIVSCALAVTEAGGVPVLVDSDPRTWQMDVSRIEERITPRTRAVMVVHIYGHPADMDPILALARRRGLLVLEDAAEAHGALYKGRPCGGFGDISVFSFYANKLVTTGEGGMILTRNRRLADRARSLRNLCFLPHRRFVHEEAGWNFRLTALQAALGWSQSRRLASIVEKKRAVAARYTERLRGVAGLSLPVEEPWARSVFWVYGVVVDEALGLDAEELGARLSARGVETRPFFLGMHEQPLFRRMGLFGGERHPVCERLSRRGLYLPSGLGLTEGEIDGVCEALEASLAQGGRP